MAAEKFSEDHKDYLATKDLSKRAFLAGYAAAVKTAEAVVAVAKDRFPNIVGAYLTAIGDETP